MQHTVYRPERVLSEEGGAGGDALLAAKYARDLDVTADVRASMGRIQSSLSKIIRGQRRDRNRLGLHTETNLASHASMVLGSIFETSIFVCASIFQIVFVRRWFYTRKQPVNQQKFSSLA